MKQETGTQAKAGYTAPQLEVVLVGQLTYTDQKNPDSGDNETPFSVSSLESTALQ